jgi:site-specific DNA-methyltransferase (adenine-specific)
MILSESPRIELIHGDCMDYMKSLEDKAFELAIVDPPYGIGVGSMKLGNAVKRGGDWDSKPPKKVFFDELYRVSLNQVIWGANHFTLPISRGWVFWDKDTNGDFSDGELAWTSFDQSLKKVKYVWDGFRKCEVSERIHPTQKPVALYKWLIKNYAKPGDRILDTHLGSGSSAIAAWEAGHDFVGIELDEDYYNAAVKRFRQHIAQTKLF